MAFWQNFTVNVSEFGFLASVLGLSIPFLAKKQTKPKQPAPTKQKVSVTELKNTLAELQAENAALRVELHQTQVIQGATLHRFQTTFYELPLPCFTVSDQGTVIEWNRACEEFFFLPEHQAVDRPISQILGSGIFRNDAEGMIYMVFLGLKPAPIEIELNIKGEPRKVKWFSSPIFNREGQVVGALNTLGVIPKVEMTNQN